MPDLGKYAEAVLSAYAAALVLLALLIVVSVRRAQRVKAELEEVERKAKKHG